MEPTNEQEKKDIEAFLKEYGELTAKRQVDFVNFPMFQPDGNGMWQIRVHTQAISTKNKPVPSPFVPQS